MEDGDEVGMDDPIFSRPLRIRKVHVVGNARTRRSVIDAELAAAKRGRTVRDVSTGIMRALRNLKQVDAFEAVEVYCDVAPGGNHGGRADMELTDVTVTVREKRMLNLKAETYVTSTGADGGIETSMTLNNPVGFTEKVNAGVSYGTKSNTATHLEVVKPRFRGLPFTLKVGARQDMASRALASSYEEKIKALRAELKHDGGRHEIGVGSAWRDIIPVRSSKNEFEYAASGLIIAQARPTLKNSLHYTFTSDRRDDPFGPTEGSFFQLRSELAGFGGDVSFAKGEVKLQQFVPVLSRVLADCALGFSFQAGVLYPLGEGAPLAPLPSRRGEQGASAPAAGGRQAFVGGSSSISDRFWLGGPMGLRGFHYKGAGPRTSPKLPGAPGGDALGGDVTWSLGYSLYLPFPHAMLHDAGLRCHLYANAGNLCAWETSFRTLVKGARASVGAGIVFPTSVGRIEANYSFVLRANSRDQQRRFQLGLGMDFL